MTTRARRRGAASSFDARPRPPRDRSGRPQRAQTLGRGSPYRRGSVPRLCSRFAQGIHPRALTEGGLTAALPVLAERAGVPVRLTVLPGRLPPTIEAAVYFLCSEALTNVAKYAHASHVIVTVGRSDDQVTAIVGGADPTRGLGLGVWPTGSRRSGDGCISRTRPGPARGLLRHCR